MIMYIFQAFPWWEFKYRKIPIDKVGYSYTNFGGIDDMTNSPGNSPRDKMNVNSNDDNKYFGFKQFSSFTQDEEEKDTEDTEDIEDIENEPEIEEEFSFRYNSSTKNEILEQNIPNRPRRKSSENLAIISEEIITFKSWCSAFWEVINVMDVCNDAKKKFCDSCKFNDSRNGSKTEKL